MKRIAVYPGSFDPFHNGHLDLVRRARTLFDEVIVAVLNNTSKTSLFTPEERVEMIREVLAEDPGCRVSSFSGLLVHFLDEIGAEVVVRGLRTASDFEPEAQMARMNRRLDGRVETVFLASSEEHGALSSSLVREIHLLGGRLEGLVPEKVLARLATTDRSI